MKRSIRNMVAFALVLLMLLPSIPAVMADTEGYYTYTVTDGEATIIACDPAISGDVVIPATLGGYPVTKIGSSAFMGCSGITSVTIPDGVTSVGDSAFRRCENMVDLVIPDSVINIETSAFSQCYSLEELVIPEGVVKIGANAFGQCLGLKSLTIPASVTSIGEYAFIICDQLMDVYITDPNAWCQIEFGADSYPLNYSYGQLHVMDAEGNEITDIVLDDTVTSIPDSAFMNANITSIVIPDTVNEIGNMAFYGCKQLTSVAIPDGVADINPSTFGSCSGLKTVSLPASINDIKYSAFGGCDSLETVYFAGTEHQWTVVDIADYNEELKNAEVICNHAHDYTLVAPKVVKATCTEDGYTEYTCIHGETYRADFVSAVGHTYSHSQDTDCNVCGEEREVLIIKTTPMYRLYNPNSGEHFYTGSVDERDVLIAAGWIYEGIAWNAPTNTGAPVYRLYNPNNSDHHYTMSAEERDNLVAVGWQYEGVAWNSAPADHPDALPLYRLYNPNADCGSHHYTGSTVERDNLVAAGWIYEGIGWFGMIK